MAPYHINIGHIEGLGVSGHFNISSQIVSATNMTSPINQTSLLEKIHYQNNPSIDTSPPPSPKLSIRETLGQPACPHDCVVAVVQAVGVVVLSTVIFVVVFVCVHLWMRKSTRLNSGGLPSDGRDDRGGQSIDISLDTLQRTEEEVSGIADQGVVDRPV